MNQNDCNDATWLLDTKRDNSPKGGVEVPVPVLPSQSDPLDEEHHSPVTYTLYEEFSFIQMVSLLPQLQLLGSKAFRVAHAFLACSLRCESPPGWVMHPQTLFPPKPA